MEKTERTADEKLLRLAQSGDRGAMEELLERHYAAIFGVCRRLMRNEEDALDRTQDACLTIVRNLGKYSGQGSFGGWVYRIAVNSCKDEWARRQRQREVAVEGAALEGGVADGAEGGWDSGSGVGSGQKPDRVGEAVEAKLDVQAALAQLPEEFRVAIVLREQAELSYQEIAELLDVPEGTVKSRIARARTELLRLLQLDGESVAP